MTDLGDTQENALAIETADERIIEVPIEIYEHVIGSLDNFFNAGTIANCAVVCRAWLPYSRYKLYRAVHLYFHRQWTCFERLMPPSISPNISRYLGMVRRLGIWPRDGEFSPKQGRSQGWRKGQKQPQWAHLVPIQCAAQLTGLTALVLTSCKFSSVLQLHSFVTAFPALSELELWGIELHSAIVPSSIPKAGPSLTRLTLCCLNNTISAVSRWLADAQLVRNLEYLDWKHCNGNIPQDVWKTVTEAIDGSFLHELHFMAPHSWRGQGSLQSELCLSLTTMSSTADFSQFTSLRVLELHYYYSWEPNQHFTSFKESLSNISSHRLEELHVQCSFGTNSLDAILVALASLKNIDAILTHPQFCHLYAVQLEYDVGVFMQAIPVVSTTSLPTSPAHAFQLYAYNLIEHKIKEELKQLNMRGIVDLQVSLFVDRE